MWVWVMEECAVGKRICSLAGFLLLLPWKF
jgi:hypothetical protein